MIEAMVDVIVISARFNGECNSFIRLDAAPARGGCAKATVQNKRNNRKPSNPAPKIANTTLILDFQK